MSAARRRPGPLHKCTCLRDSHTCTIRYLSRLTTYRSAAIPAGRGLGRPDLPGTKRQAAIQNLAATVGLEPTSIRLTGGRSAIELHSKYVGGRRKRAQPGLKAAAFPLKDSAPTSTQSTLLKSCSGHKKTPVGSNQPGFLSWSFPGRFDVRAFQKPFKEGLSHRFHAVKRHMHGYRAQTYVTVVAIAGECLPARASGA